MFRWSSIQENASSSGHDSQLGPRGWTLDLEMGTMHSRPDGRVEPGKEALSEDKLVMSLLKKNNMGQFSALSFKH